MSSSPSRKKRPGSLSLTQLRFQSAVVQRTPLSASAQNNHKDALRQYIDTVSQPKEASVTKVQSAMREYIDHVHQSSDERSNNNSSAVDSATRSQVEQWIDTVNGTQSPLHLKRNASPRTKQSPSGRIPAPSVQEVRDLAVNDNTHGSTTIPHESPTQQRDDDRMFRFPEDPSAHRASFSPATSTTEEIPQRYPEDPSASSHHQPLASSSGSTAIASATLPASSSETVLPVVTHPRMVPPCPEVLLLDSLRPAHETPKIETEMESNESSWNVPSHHSIDRSETRARATGKEMNAETKVKPTTEATTAFFPSANTSVAPEYARPEESVHVGDPPNLNRTTHRHYRTPTKKSLDFAWSQHSSSPVVEEYGNDELPHGNNYKTTYQFYSPSSDLNTHEEVARENENLGNLPKDMMMMDDETPERDNDDLALALQTGYLDYLRQAPPPPPPPASPHPTTMVVQPQQLSPQPTVIHNSPPPSPSPEYPVATPTIVHQQLPPPPPPPRTVHQDIIPPPPPVPSNKSIETYTDVLGSLPENDSGLRESLHSEFLVLPDDSVQFDMWVDKVLASRTQWSSRTVAELLEKAREHSLSLHTADRFLDSCEVVLQNDDGKEDTGMSFLERVLCYTQENKNRVDKYDSIVSDSFEVNDVREGEDGVMEVEIEAFGGFSRNEDAMMEEVEEPWWEVAKRLGVSAAEPSQPHTIIAFHSKEETDELKNQKSLDEDIDEFWNERNRKRTLVTRRKAAFETSQKKSYDRPKKESPSRLLRAVSQLSERIQNDLSIRPRPINAVSSTRQFSRKGRKCMVSHLWQMPFDRRTESGSLSVDAHSLYSTSMILSDRHELDNVPWESRGVKQRFLQSMMDRNWFGTCKRIKGNKVRVQPVCRPKSMEMPMLTNVDWVQDASRKATFDALGPAYAPYVDGGDDDDSWEETPECGRIINVQLQPGERISRVTPNHTSSLRRSRWRKKYC